MPPLLSLAKVPSSIFHPIRSHLTARTLTSVSEFKNQWSNPNDILSLLLLLGPDVLKLALAQLAGRRITPVAFSFGWAAYSISALFTAIGGTFPAQGIQVDNFSLQYLDQRLMPHSGFRAIVVGAKSGHARENKSWVIGRILRDYELREKPHTQDKNSPDWEALRVSVFKCVSGSKAGRPALDFVWYSGFVVVLIQLSIAVIPLCLFGEWIVMVITIFGTLLAFSHGALPQWGREKWDCPRRGGGTATITQGNGSRHAMVVLGGPDTPDLEILAYSDGNTVSAITTRTASAVQTLLWLALVISVAGLKQGSWCKCTYTIAVYQLLKTCKTCFQ